MSDCKDNSHRLVILACEHREMDEKIKELQSYPIANQLQIQRLKKEKLRLKDALDRLRSQQIPDIDA